MSVREVEAVQRAVRESLDPHERLVLAVSGGLDSMTLLHAAAHAVPRSRITVATFDHRTGPAAIDAARLVALQSDALGIECVVGRADRTVASEADLREARWRFLRETAAARGAVVATAHTEDDQIETVLMRTMRAAGARGLAALYAASDVVRPVIEFRRAHLEAYAAACGLNWVEDPSNQSRRYLRNRVRHDLLPALRRVQPSIDAELLAVANDAAEWRRDVEAFVAATVAPEMRQRASGLDVNVSLMADRSLSELSTLWPAIAARAGIRLDRRGTARLAAFTVRSDVGAAIQLAGGWTVVRSRDAFQLRASAERRPRPRALSSNGGVDWGDWSFRLASEPVGTDAMSAWLPEDDELSVRCWQPGDTMIAAPGRPTRKVKQLLSRAGITGHDRAGWPVVLAGDRIVWIPGVRRVDAATARSGRPGLPFVCEHNRR